MGSLPFTISGLSRYVQREKSLSFSSILLLTPYIEVNRHSGHFEILDVGPMREYGGELAQKDLRHVVIVNGLNLVHDSFLSVIIWGRDILETQVQKFRVRVISRISRRSGHHGVGDRV